MPSKRLFIQLHDQVNGEFIYTTDMEQFGVVEHWRIPVLNEDGKFLGDCDDRACRMFGLGRAAGFQMRVVTLFVPTRTSMGGHAVAYCDDLGLVSDNMHRSVYEPGWLSGVEWDRMSGVNTLAPSKWRRARLV